MKNKGQKIFLLIFVLLISFMSVTIVGLYDNAKGYDSNKVNGIQDYYKEQFQIFTFDLAEKLDPSYDPLIFSSKLSDEEKKMISAEYEAMRNDFNAFFTNDSAFFYVAEDLDTGNIVSNLSDPKQDSSKTDDHRFYVSFRFDEKGECSISGDLTLDIFDAYNFYALFPSVEDVYYPEIQINPPENMEFQFMISSTAFSYLGISGYLNSWDQFNAFGGISFFVAAAVLFVFLLFYPIRYVSEVQPFKTIRNWSIEINLFLLPSLVTLAFMVSMLSASFTINGEFSYLLNEYGLIVSDMIVLGFNFVIWFLSMIILSLTIFELKYIVVYGPIRFIKEHSLTASCIRWIKKTIDDLFTVDLSMPFYKQLLLLILGNALVMLFFGILNFSLMIVCTLLYSIALFYFIYRHLIEIQQDYHKLLASIRGIVSNHFEKTDEDFGIFASGREELEKLSVNFEEAVQEKVRSEKMKTELISNVSHDLKTPLTCIKNYAALLDDDALSSEKRHEYQEKLKKYANRLKTLIDDLLEISKVESGNLKLEPANLNIIDLLDQVYMQSEEALNAKNITVIRHYADKKLILCLDSNKTYRIFENLFTNISKYAMPNSRAYVSVKEENGRVKIEMNNVSEQPMDFTSSEIMERFVRGDKSRSQQGSGLGLAIARSFTQAQGGTFELKIDCDLFKVRIEFEKEQEK